jgi:hypothetical protein
MNGRGRISFAFVVLNREEIPRRRRREVAERPEPGQSFTNTKAGL